MGTVPWLGGTRLAALLSSVKMKKTNSVRFQEQHLFRKKFLQAFVVNV